MKDKKRDQFLEILSNYDKDKMKDFLINNGKDPKPICPIWFIPENADIKDYI